MISAWHFEFNFFCINENADTDNSYDTGLINVHRYFWIHLELLRRDDFVCGSSQWFADDVDTYTMHCAACWTLTLPSCMGIVAKGGMEV